MNLELFPAVEPSHLEDLLREIDAALDASFLSDVEAAFERARSDSEPISEASAA